MDEYVRFDIDLFDGFSRGYQSKKVVKKYPRCSIKDRRVYYVYLSEIYN